MQTTYAKHSADSRAMGKMCMMPDAEQHARLCVGLDRPRFLNERTVS